MGGQTLRQRPSLGADFQRWVSALRAGSGLAADRAQLTGFRHWASRLPPARADDVAREIAGLCALPGFDRAWFQSLLRRPELDTAPARMVFYFSLAVYERWRGRHGLMLWAWLSAPRAATSRDLGWLLYLRLVEAGRARLPGIFLMATSAQRARIIEAAIREAYAHDRDLLLALTRELSLIPSGAPENSGYVGGLARPADA